MSLLQTSALVVAAAVCIAAPCSAQGTAAGAKAPAKPPAAKPAAPRIPPSIEAAFTKAYPKAVVKNVSKETAAGKTIYEVESVDGGRARNLDYNPDGSLISYEEELTEAEIPAAVMAAIKARYPTATVTTRERLFTVKDNSSNFELGLKGAAVAEIVLTADGAWVTPKLPVKK
jgi:hypothetical protein